jgi:hypothetical protein
MNPTPDPAFPPEDTLERHKWLAKALLQYREQQVPAITGVLPHGEAARAAVARYYYLLLEDLIPLEKGLAAFEIISDGLGQPEPHWHGVRVTTSGCSPIGDSDREVFGAIVKEHRHSVGGSVPSTHRGLAEYLQEPALFCVLGKKQAEGLLATDVQFYREGKWYPLTSAAPLPLQQKTAIDRERIIREINGTLRDLSQKVLWPAFWTVNPARKYASLIAIYSTPSQQNAGVWAIHAASNDISEWGDIKLKEWAVRQVMDPPMLCLFDVLAAEYERSSTHHSRIDDVRFYARALGVIEVGRSPEQLFASFKPARLIYERSADRDPLADYGPLLWQVIAKHLGKEKEAVAQAKPIPTVAIEQAFVAYRIAALSPRVATDDLTKRQYSGGVVELLHRHVEELCNGSLSSAARSGFDPHTSLEEKLARMLFEHAAEMGEWLNPTIHGLLALVRGSIGTRRLSNRVTVPEAHRRWLEDLGFKDTAANKATVIADHFNLWPVSLRSAPSDERAAEIIDVHNNTA